MTASGFKLTACWFLALGLAGAQGYPPGGYPGGQAPYPGTTPYPGQTPYPGGRGPGIPIPSRGGKQAEKKTEPAQPLPSFRGVLKLLDEKTVTLSMGDNRVLDFKRTSKTRFLEKGAEVKPAQFQEGVEITVEALEELGGYLTAVNVHLEGPAKPREREKEGVVDTWAKDAPGAPPAPEPSGAKESTATRTPAPAPRDPDDPGPPRLTRGRPSDPSRQVSAPPPSNEVSAAPVRPVPDEPGARPGAVADDRLPSLTRGPAAEPSPNFGAPPTDPLIRRAALAALEFTEGLPAYVCQEVIARFQSETKKPDWRALDIVTTNLVYENGREEYRDIMINGKKSAKSMEESGGAWSTGEFGTVLIDLFSPATAAEFHYSRESRLAGAVVKQYTFDVPQDRSHWLIHSGSQKYRPAYRGSVWIDPQTARVMRIEMQAYGFPEAFPIDHSETTTEYQNVRLGDAKQYLLPVHSENLSCQRGTSYCSKNVIDFRNYRKYSGEATISFSEIKEVPKAKEPPKK